MTAAYDRSSQWLLAAALVIPLVIAVLHFLLAPPLLSHDTAIGWQIWQSMVDGSGWNQLSTPDQTDISRSTESFITWWTPGQYLPIGILTKLGLPLGGAMLLTSLAGAWSLALGLWCLLTALGTTSQAAGLASLAVASSWHTLYQFGFFVGGEVALLAVWPWILWGAWRIRLHPGWQLVLLPLIFLAGSVAKLSFGLYAIGLLTFLWWTEAESCGWRWRPMLLSALRFGAVVAIYAVAWHWLFVRHGPSPVSNHAPVAAPMVLAGFALNAPWFSAVGFGSLAGRLFLLQGIDSDTGWSHCAPWLLAGGLVAAAGYCLLVCQRSPLPRLTGIICLTAALLLLGVYMRGAAISLEDRHLRPAGILLLATGAHAACTVSGTRRRLLFSGLVLVIAFGVGSALQRLGNLRTHAVRTADGRSMLDIDAASLRFLESADRDGTLVCLPRVEFGSLIRHGRVLIDESLAADPARTRIQERHGRVSSLLLVLPAVISSDGRAKSLQASFVDYRETEWTLVHHGSWDFWLASTSLPAAP